MVVFSNRSPFVLIPLLAILMACSGCDNVTGPETKIDGSYFLRTFDGQELPATVNLIQNGWRMRISSASLEITGTAFALAFTTTESHDHGLTWEAVALIFSGRLTKSANSLSFVFDPPQNPDIITPNPMSGTWDGADQIVVQESVTGMTYLGVFRR